MKKYFKPELSVSVFTTEDVIMISAATTEAAVIPGMGGDMIASGYEFISNVTHDAAEDVQAGAVFSWN